MDNYGIRATTDLKTRNQAESVVKRVYLAIKHLCTSQRDVRKRLVGAIKILLPLQVLKFPEELQADFNWVMAQSTKHKSQIPEYEGNIEATMKKIRNSTGEKIAERIFSIYSGLQDIRGFPLLEYRNPND
ncbi:MAG: hypothetical protein QM504_08715 [Pseudomonadota bacterium]